MTLGEAFLTARRGAPPTDDLEPLLRELCRRARATWPLVKVADERFCGHLGARVPADADPARALATLHSDDLYLALACSIGDAAALRIFDERFLAHTGEYLRRLRADEQLVEETRQLLRVRLLLSGEGAPPRIAQYGGTGPLGSWVRVAAVRQALNSLDSRRRHEPGDALDEDLVPAGGDLELDYLRERYRAPFAVALRHSIAALPPMERALLRFHFVDGFTPGHIGEIYGVHRTTIMRRIADAKAELLERTRKHIMRELQVTPSECDSLVALVAGRLPMTLSSLFRSRAP